MPVDRQVDRCINQYIVRRIKVGCFFASEEIEEEFLRFDTILNLVVVETDIKGV